MIGIITRLSNDEIFMAQAIIAGAGSTCRRRAVGCVLVNKHNHIVAVGRNGVPAKLAHCIDVPCGGETLPSGQGLDACLSPHAEQSAISQCPAVMEVTKAYVTASPCISCVKMLLNTACQEVVYLDEYAHSQARELWFKGRPGIIRGDDIDTIRPTWRQLTSPYLHHIFSVTMEATGR